MRSSPKVAPQPETADPSGMAGAGRPPKPASLRKSERLVVMLTKAQRRELEKAAAKAGLELSTWIRDVALQAAGK